MKSPQILSFTALLITLISFSSCLHNTDFICDNADGGIETQIIELGDFEGIDLNIAADVYLTEGAVQEVKITGKTDAIAKLEREIDNGIWEIEFDECVRNHDIEIHITMPKLTSVSISGSGDVIGETAFNSTDENVDFKISGSGYLSLEMNANKIHTKISGSGDARLSGSATEHELKISGSGSLNGFGLVATDQITTISGSGSAEVFVDGGILDAKISGSGKVYYKGNPTSFSADVSGSGKVIDAN
jgi:hypothetical protein